MKASTFASGKFIKAADAKTPFLAIIRDAVVQEFQKTGPGSVGVDKKLALVLDVAGEERMLALNKTMNNILIAAFGDETDLWIGKRIAVYWDPSVAFGGKTVGGIRVKVPGQKTAAERALEAQRAAEAMFDTSFEPAQLEKQPATETPAEEDPAIL